MHYWSPRRRGGKGEKKAYLKKQWLRTSQTWGEIWTSKFMKLIGDSKISTPKSCFPRQLRIKLSKIKENEIIFKAAREKKNLTYMGTPIRLLMNFSAETL